MCPCLPLQNVMQNIHNVLACIPGRPLQMVSTGINSPGHKVRGGWWHWASFDLAPLPKPSGRDGRNLQQTYSKVRGKESP